MHDVILIKNQNKELFSNYYISFYDFVFSEVFVLSLRCDTLHNVISFARASVITTIHPCLAFSIRLIFVPASLIQ